MSDPPKNGQQHWAAVLGSLSKTVRIFGLALLIFDGMCAVFAFAPSAHVMTLFWVGAGVSVSVLAFFGVILWKNPVLLVADTVDDIEKLKRQAGAVKELTDLMQPQIDALREAVDALPSHDALADALRDLDLDDIDTWLRHEVDTLRSDVDDIMGKME
jgi:hypothetical protein